MATLQRISPTKSEVYTIARSMRCGDRYKKGQTHLFNGDNKEQTDLLIFIFKKLKIKIEILNDTQFTFTTGSERYQIMMFRLCRYVRHVDVYKILISIKELIESGIKPYNAILLAHYINRNNGNYANGMDVVTNHAVSSHYTFRSWNEFINNVYKSENTTSTIYYRSNFNNVKIQFIKSLIDKGEYKEVQRLLYRKRPKKPNNE